VKLPSLQPGSSIMPGKVNPVIPEMVIQVAARIMGMNTTVATASQTGPLELNIMMPLLASELIEGMSLLTNTVQAFGERCVRGIEADEERCTYWVEWSLALVTPLATRIGYDKAAEIAYQAYREGRTVLDIAKERQVLSEAELEQVLDPRSMLNR
jgi:fumarate hydratase class II